MEYNDFVVTLTLMQNINISGHTTLLELLIEASNLWGLTLFHEWFVVYHLSIKL
jgi:hypothetical protein